jgi:hypothetical protein
MRVSSIRYQPIEGGTLGGHFALHVTLGASSGPDAFYLDLSPTELSGKIHDAFETLDLKSKSIRGVLIDARNDEPNTAEMMALLGTLHDWNMHTVSWVSEKTRAAWFEMTSFIVVFVKSVHWPNFRVNEIRFEPSGEAWVEPDIYEVNANVPSYVYTAISGLSAGVLPFVCSAKRPWGVILPIRSTYAVNFPLGE